MQHGRPLTQRRLLEDPEAHGIGDTSGISLDEWQEAEVLPRDGSRTLVRPGRGPGWQLASGHHALWLCSKTARGRWLLGLTLSSDSLNTEWWSDVHTSLRAWVGELEGTRAGSGLSSCLLTPCPPAHMSARQWQEILRSWCKPLWLPVNHAVAWVCPWQPWWAGHFIPQVICKLYLEVDVGE